MRKVKLQKNSIFLVSFLSRLLFSCFAERNKYPPTIFLLDVYYLLLDLPHIISVLLWQNFYLQGLISNQ